MKHFATAALMLNFGVACIYAEPGSVSMAVSGTAANSTVLLTGPPASEYNLAGGGIQDPFTLRVVNSSAPSTPPTTCSGPNNFYLASGAGAGVLRSQDGSLLTLNLTGGSDCIDFLANHAVCIRIFQITGGTGRFKNASGSVTLTMTVVPILGPPNNPVFFSVTGDLTGIVSKVSGGQGPLD